MLTIWSSIKYNEWNSSEPATELDLKEVVLQKLEMEGESEPGSVQRQHDLPHPLESPIISIYVVCLIGTKPKC